MQGNCAPESGRILSSSQVIDYWRAGKDLVHSLISSEIDYRIEVVPPLGRVVFVCFRLFFTSPGIDRLYFLLHSSLQL
ncbi:hypothetical protein EYB25_007103 [Talaromyces marneffei]|nr:hypothetical protein EYB25_007103 [Talaromyces marneffei]